MTLYTKDQHDRSMANLQKTLNKGLALLREHLVNTNSQILSGKDPANAEIVTVFNTLYWGNRGMLIINWGKNFLRIQYNHAGHTNTPADSTMWNDKGECIRDGHIQTAYSREVADPEYAFDMVGFLGSIQTWEVQPKKKD